MPLFRDFRDLTTAGETPASIAADSANIFILIDSVDTGNPVRESLKSNLDELVSILNALGVGGAVDDATETVKGIVEISDNTEINNGTDIGATGATVVVIPSQLQSLINPLQIQFESNVITTKEFAFVGNTRFLSLDFAVTEIDSIDIETRTAAGTTYTSRADLTALNSFSESIGASTVGYVRLSANYDAAYEGRATALIKSKPLL